MHSAKVRTYFRNKNVLITGAASGMGRALAENLSVLGATVIATDVDKQGLDALIHELKANGGNAISRVLDITDQKAFASVIDEIVKSFGRLDVLFNNAGIALFGEARDQTDEDWQRIIDIDLWGLIHGTRLAYDQMVMQGQGHIVNTASVAGLAPMPLLVPYATAKHAVVGLSTSLREEGAALGVRVSCVCPGVVRTAITDGDFTRNADVGNPFEMVDQRLKLGTIDSQEAAREILRGVARNQALIIFPAHGRAIARAARLTPKIAAGLSQAILRRFRKEMRRG